MHIQTELERACALNINVDIVYYTACFEAHGEGQGLCFIAWAIVCQTEGQKWGRLLLLNCLLASRYGLAKELSDGTVRPVTSSELKGVQEQPRSPSTAATSPAHSTRSRQKVFPRSRNNLSLQGSKDHPCMWWKSLWTNALLLGLWLLACYCHSDVQMLLDGTKATFKSMQLNSDEILWLSG